MVSILVFISSLSCLIALYVTSIKIQPIKFSRYNFNPLNLKELIITDTELKLIANAAIIGDSKMPKNGYKSPAATGMPRTL